MTTTTDQDAVTVEPHLPAGMTEERKEELQRLLNHADNVATSLYGTLFAANYGAEWHAYLEWVGCMREHVKVAQASLNAGIDFTEANRHTGKKLRIHGYQLDYLNEKIGCIFSEQLRVIGSLQDTQALPGVALMLLCAGYAEKRYGLKSETLLPKASNALTESAILREIDMLKSALAGERGRYWMNKALSAQRYFTTKYGIRKHHRDEHGNIKRKLEYRPGDCAIPNTGGVYNWLTHWAIERLIGRTVVSLRAKFPEAIVQWDPKEHIPAPPEAAAVSQD
jgi:hypothetical protein